MSSESDFHRLIKRQFFYLSYISCHKVHKNVRTVSGIDFCYSLLLQTLFLSPYCADEDFQGQEQL